MVSSRAQALSIAELGALALSDAAAALDSADSAAAFLGALDHNRRIWTRLGEVAATLSWTVPDSELVAYALRTTDPSVAAAGRDDHIQSLIDINTRLSAQLAGGDADLARLRERARALWEAEGRDGADGLGGWLVATIEGWAD